MFPQGVEGPRPGNHFRDGARSTGSSGTMPQMRMLPTSRAASSVAKSAETTSLRDQSSQFQVGCGSAHHLAVLDERAGVAAEGATQFGVGVVSGWGSVGWCQRIQGEVGLETARAPTAEAAEYRRRDLPTANFGRRPFSRNGQGLAPQTPIEPAPFVSRRREHPWIRHAPPTALGQIDLDYRGETEACRPAALTAGPVPSNG
jgi:hypothetical protein